MWWTGRRGRRPLHREHPHSSSPVLCPPSPRGTDDRPVSGCRNSRRALHKENGSLSTSTQGAVSGKRTGADPVLHPRRPSYGKPISGGPRRVPGGVQGGKANCGPSRSVSGGVVRSSPSPPGGSLVPFWPARKEPAAGAAKPPSPRSGKSGLRAGRCG